MTYNTTSIDNVTDTTSWLVNINTEANGLPGIGALILLFIATFVYSTNRNLDPGESFLASSFVCSIIGALFYFIGFISLTVEIVCLTLLFLGIIYLMFK